MTTGHIMSGINDSDCVIVPHDDSSVSSGVRCVTSPLCGYSRSVVVG